MSILGQNWYVTNNHFSFVIINALTILVEAFVQAVVSKGDQLHMLGGPKVKAPPSFLYY